MRKQKQKIRISEIRKKKKMDLHTIAICKFLEENSTTWTDAESMSIWLTRSLSHRPTRSLGQRSRLTRSLGRLC
jgi:hypothetical protein